MPLRVSLAALAVLVASPLALAQSLAPGAEDAAGSEPAPSRTVSGGQILYDQSDSFTRGYITQTTIDTPAYDTISADDFVVPAGASWIVTGVATPGKYISDTTMGPARCTSADIGFWTDGGTEPGALLFRYDDTPTASGVATGLVEFTIPETPLAAGTYWLSITCKGDLNLDISDSDGDPIDIRRWFWYRNNDNDATQGLGATAVSRNDGGGYGNPPGWFALTSTTVTEGFDYNFVLSGVLTTAMEARPARAAASIGVTIPNPSVASARVPFSLRAPAEVRMSVHDVLGREVAVVASGPYTVGEHEANFDASSLAPGAYVVRLVAGSAVITRVVSIVR